MNSVPLKRTLLSNAVGQLANLLIALAVTPLYLRYIGAEGYGLFGFLASLLAILNVLDLGLSVSINRELARHIALEVPAELSRDLLRTLEVGYVAVGIILGVCIAGLAPWIAGEILQAGSIDQKTLRTAVVLMGVIVMLRWPVSLYGGVLRGRDHQVAWNAVVVIEAVVRAIVSILALVYLSKSVTVVLACFAVCSGVQLVILAVLAWQAMPRSPSPPRFQLETTRAVRRFTSQMAFSSFTAVALKQTDTILIAALLPLADLGYYVLAWSICSVLLVFSTTVFTSVVPRLSMLVAGGREADLRSLYHRSCQVVTYCVAPLGIGLALFSHDLLQVWTGSSTTADRGDVVVSMLAFAFLFNALTQMPVALQVASGRMNVVLWVNGLGAVFGVPLIYLGIKAYGLAGAGMAWFAFNLAALIVGPFLMHRRILAGEHRRWIREDCGPFLGLACAMMLAAYIGSRFVDGPLAAGTLGGMALLAYGAIGSRWCEPAAELRRRILSRERSGRTIGDGGSGVGL